MVRRSTLLLLFALVVASCTSDDGSTSTVGDNATTTTVGVVTTIPDVSTTTTQAAPAVTAPDLADVDLPDAVKTQLARLIEEAQEIRGLPFLSSPTIVVVTGEELEARVREAFEEEIDEFPADEALYKLLGLLQPDDDLFTLLTDLYGESVAGFYDGEKGEIVVPALEDGFSILQEGTLIHELVHALTDQHFGFDEIFRAMADEDRLDEATAYQALIEGDASLAEVKWVQQLSQRELGQFVAEAMEIDNSALGAVPQFISDSLIFPYDSGLVFVQQLFDEGGGWEAVNEAYTVLPDLPGSSEQVITPDDYKRDLPVVVEMPSITLSGYELERTSVWGEAGFRTMLDQVFAGSTAATAADGWGGDGYHQWFDGENAAFLLVYQGDTERDLEELEETLLDYARSTVPEEDFVWVDTTGGLLYFIAADEVAVGELIRSSVGLG